VTPVLMIFNGGFSCLEIISRFVERVNIAYNCTTSSSSAENGFKSILAVDGILETCFASQTETNPFLQVTFKELVFIYKVVITENKDCCKQQSPLKVTATDTKNQRTTCKSSSNQRDKRVSEYNCISWRRTEHLKVTRPEVDSTLQICEVEVFAIDDFHGVIREVWLLKGAYYLKLNRLQELTQLKLPDLVHTIKNFEAPKDVLNEYGQRLSAYIQIPETGNYTFSISCRDDCILFYREVADIMLPQKVGEAIFVASNTPPKQSIRLVAQPNILFQIYLHKCVMYYLEAYMTAKQEYDHLSIGIRRVGDGRLVRPISNKHLYKTQTGNRAFSMVFDDTSNITAVAGSNVNITGFFRYCCDGIHCPNCPLYLYDERTTKLLNTFSEMSCNRTKFTMVLDEYILGKHTLKANTFLWSRNGKWKRKCSPDKHKYHNTVVCISSKLCRPSRLYSMLLKSPTHVGYDVLDSARLQCRGNKFQCDNKQCIDVRERCNGDGNCFDNSDEEDCPCLSSDFLCPSGQCIKPEELCDDKNNCEDGADEINCGKRRIHF
ncbi:hypothetical protein QZH41_015958, partial [Actinostola sp. cb2023]